MSFAVLVFFWPGKVKLTIQAKPVLGTTPPNAAPTATVRYGCEEWAVKIVPLLNMLWMENFMPFGYHFTNMAVRVALLKVYATDEVAYAAIGIFGGNENGATLRNV